MTQGRAFGIGVVRYYGRLVLGQTLPGQKPPDKPIKLNEPRPAVRRDGAQSCAGAAARRHPLCRLSRRRINHHSVSLVNKPRNGQSLMEINMLLIGDQD